MRQLNDYESMLAAKTCNFAISLTMPSLNGDCSLLKKAWDRCILDYQLLQTRLKPREGDVGPLGQRFDLIPACPDEQKALFNIQRCKSLAADALVKELQCAGTTCLDILKGTYFVSCRADTAETDGKLSVSIIVVLCHAVSDGPGALRVAGSFMRHLGDCANMSNSSLHVPKAQPILDLQRRILGADYGSSLEVNNTADTFVDLEEVRTALLSEDKAILVNGIPFLPPEEMQQLPADPGFGTEPGVIDTVHDFLSAPETESLIARCRSRGATIQGALSLAFLVARIALLNLSFPHCAALQIPANCRKLAAVGDDTCVCGSAGIWHLANLRGDMKAFPVSKTMTDSVRRAAQGGQQREWLAMLFNSPGKLPPYSVMESSVGVTPVEEKYGDVTVDELMFFGGALRTGSIRSVQKTMVHAISFRGRLQLMFNFTSPGVSLQFAESSVRAVKAVLYTMAVGPNPDEVSLSALLSDLRGLAK